MQRGGFRLEFRPELAKLIGVEAAIVLQRIVFLCDTPFSGKEINGFRWIWNTLEQWQKEHFPFWSERTIRRIIDSLEESGILVSCQPDGYMSRKKYYRISEGAFENLSEEAASHVDNLDSSMCPSWPHPSGQSGHIEAANLATSITDQSQRRSTEKTQGHGLASFSDVKNKKKGTLEEVVEYARELGLPRSDGEFLFDYWESNGWKLKNQPIADWRAALRTRKRNKWLPSLDGSIPPEDLEIDYDSMPGDDTDPIKWMIQNRLRLDEEEAQPIEIED